MFKKKAKKEVSGEDKPFPSEVTVSPLSCMRRDIRVRFRVTSIYECEDGSRVSLRLDKPPPEFISYTSRSEVTITVDRDTAYLYFKPGAVVTMAVVQPEVADVAVR